MLCNCSKREKDVALKKWENKCQSYLSSNAYWKACKVMQLEVSKGSFGYKQKLKRNLKISRMSSKLYRITFTKYATVTQVATLCIHPVKSINQNFKSGK